LKWAFNRHPALFADATEELFEWAFVFVNTRSFEGSILVPFADQVNHESRTLIAPCIINTELHKSNGYQEYGESDSFRKANINIDRLYSQD